MRGQYLWPICSSDDVQASIIWYLRDIRIIIDPIEAKRHIITRAQELKCTYLLPDDWRDRYIIGDPKQDVL